MAKRNSEKDPFHDYNEWINHQYNPYYFVNKVSFATRSAWGWADRHPRATAIFIILLYGPTLFILIREFVMSFRAAGMPFLQFLGENDFFVGWFFLIFLLTFIVVGYAIHFFRAPKGRPSEEPVEKRTHRKQSKRNRLPKRRKDYK